MRRLTMSVQEAGAILGLGRTKIYELINAGDIDAVKAGRRTLVTIKSTKRFIKARLNKRQR